MNPSNFLRLLILVSSVPVAIHGAEPRDTTVSLPKADANPITVYDYPPAFGSIKSGRVLLVPLRIRSANEPGGTPQLHHVLYQSATGGLVLISGRISGVNLMLREELPTKEASVEYLKKDELRQLLLAVMARGDVAIVDERRVAEEATGTPSRLKLEQHLQATRTSLESESWRFEFFIVDRRSREVHKWTVTGKVWPFAIISFQQELIETLESMAGRSRGGML